MSVLDLELKSLRLRKALDDMVTTGPSHVPNHPQQVSSLHSCSRHNIELACDPDVAGIPLDNFTCFMHALSLAKSETAKKIASALPSTFVSSDFVAFLANSFLEIRPVTEVLEGDIILYWEDEAIIHAGKVASGRVLSKWGTGHLWKHDVFEVPLSYGSQVVFYRPLVKSVAEQFFVNYAKERDGVDLVEQLLHKG